MNYKYLILYIGFFIPFIVSAHTKDYRSIEFVENKGQWDGPFLYKATFGNVDVFLDKGSVTYLLADEANAVMVHDYKFGVIKKLPKLKYHAYRVSFINANSNPEIRNSKTQAHYYNYYYGSNRSKWQSGIHPHLALDYKDVYDGIDMHFASDHGNMKYDFIVNPNANADQIKLKFEGQDKISIAKGDLVIETSVGDIHELKPYAYQYIDNEKVEVPCKYKLKNGILEFAFPRGYDESKTLIIDPTIVFTTFTGSTADNWGFTATYDPQGNFYAGGIANGNGYPSTLGPTFQGGTTTNGLIESDIAITKFAAGGGANSIIYSTYIGGSDNEQPHSMIVSNNGDLFISGRSQSSNYPNTTARGHKGGADIIATRLNATGTLTASTFIGGSGDDGVNIDVRYDTVKSLKHNRGDDARSEILVDRNDNVYIASCTRSADFADTLHSLMPGVTGDQDAVVLKLDNTLSSILWGSIIGGKDNDAAYVIAFSKDESSIYVSGGTGSDDFHSVTGGFTNALWPVYQGGVADGYILKFKNSGSYNVERATMIGRGQYDQCFGIQVDDEDNVYVNGQTLGGGFPVTSGVYRNANSSQFLMKLDSTLSTNIYSTVFGSGTPSSCNIIPTAFLVDTCQNVYISGWGGAIALNNGNTSNMPVNITTNPPTPSGIIRSTTDGNDFYFIVFSKNATSILFSGYYGGDTKGEHVDGGTSRFDRNGVIYQAICGGCGNNTQPSAPMHNSHSAQKGGSNCNFLALKIAFNLGSVSAKASASPNSIVCLGDPVSFSSAGSANATSYEWDFGDGNTSSASSPNHTYGAAGTYNVRMIVVNPDACITRDTTFLQVVVSANSIDAEFTSSHIDSCDPFITRFTNTSKFGNTPGTASFQWDFGDGKTYSGNTPPAHTYPTNGTYTVRLIMSDPNACNNPDTFSKDIAFNNLYVKSDYFGPTEACEKVKVSFTNRSSDARSFEWDFGDGNTSTENNPEHSFDTAGTYTVQLKAFNPVTCNLVDSISKSVTVHPTPIASFIHKPIIPITNEPITFINQSQGASSYIWGFGDATGSDQETPEPKLYRKTGDYLVCLQAINSFGCADTVCRYVSADIYPLADVPTGFSPNGDGNNDILYVKGAAIESLNFKVYNRWGELVFETDDLNKGWDGKTNGKEQPVEAYGYVLNVTFIDGSVFYKKGNVTLLR